MIIIIMMTILMMLMMMMVMMILVMLMKNLKVITCYDITIFIKSHPRYDDEQP